MTTTNSVASSTDTSAALAAANASTASTMSDTQSQFLTLLVTQLQNQDPLNPMDNAEVTSQIAQLSTVNGINQLNNTLLALSGQVGVSQSMQAASLIGKGVLVPGSKVSLGSDPSDPTVKQATPFGVDVISPATDVVVTIKDSTGKAVRQMDLGAQPAGVVSVSWDGKGDGGVALPDGAYDVSVAAKSSTDDVAAQTLTYGVVSGVQYSSDGPMVNLGLAGNFSVKDIYKIMS